MLKWLLVTCLTCAAPLMAVEKKVLAFSGSLREDSFNKKLVNEAAKIAAQMGAQVKVIDLKDYPMPFYDADLESKFGLPEQAKRLRDLMIGSDAIIIASPEYNGSLSGILKNTIDWMSRGEDAQFSRDAFKDKLFAIMSSSPGGGGGKRGLDHLRVIIQNVGGKVITAQTVIPNAADAFTSQGSLKNPDQQEQLRQEIIQLLQ